MAKREIQMTLQDAIRMMGTASTISSESDGALVRSVDNAQAAELSAHPKLPYKPVITAALGVHGDFEMRPIAAMLEIARGTVLNEDPDIAAFARRWSILRYLGIFARDAGTGKLHLDGAALRYVGGNQRRVLSEELGIGFGIIAGKRWCRKRMPTIGSITAIDVDKALKRGKVPNLRPEGNRQPDYLLSYSDSRNPGVKIYDLLETKGTGSRAYAKKQLGRAVTQLAGLTLNHQEMTGIAVTTVSDERGIHVMAVDPEEPPVAWRPTNAALVSSRAAKGPFPPDDFKVDLPREEFLAAATNVGFAGLAEFSGQRGVATRWFPDIDSERKDKVDARVPRETAAGSFVGTEYVLMIPGASDRLRVFQGVDKDVAEGLRALDVTAVLESQQAFARSHAGYSDISSESIGDTAAASAFTSDGSMLEISIA